MGRSIGAVIAGAVAAVIVIMGVEMVSNTIYPLPDGLDPNDAEQMREHIATLPIGAFLFVLTAYLFGSISGGVVAARIGGALLPAMIVAGLLEVANAMNFIAIPHPTWFIVISVLIYFPAAWVGARLALRKQAEPGESP